MCLPNEPTKNAEYNYLLQQWGNSGYSNEPICENCDCDLTDKEVYDTGHGWICESCHEESFDIYISDYDERMNERRQMGLE